MSPQRIQRKRTRGWRMPAGVVYVGRPTKWGNPHRPPRPVRAAGQGPGVLVSARGAVSRGRALAVG